MSKDLIPVRAIKDALIVDITDRGEKTTTGGIIIPDDDFKEYGVRPRKALVLSVGPVAAKDGIEPGQTVLLEHGGWTRNHGLKVKAYDGTEHRIWMTKTSFVYGILD